MRSRPEITRPRDRFVSILVVGRACDVSMAVHVDSAHPGRWPLRAGALSCKGDQMVPGQYDVQDVICLLLSGTFIPSVPHTH